MIQPKSLNDANAFTGEVEKVNQSQQRTDEWLIERAPCFTGSEFSKLMSCGRSTSKMPWGSMEKLVDFGATAEKYIYNVGQQRRTDILSMQISGKPLEHGEKNEPLVIEQLIKDGVITDFVEKGFERFYKYGGASVDGVAIYKKLLEELCIEIKSPVSWDGHYARMYGDVDENHPDFWQMQAEMLSVKLKKCLYVVAMPMQYEKYDSSIVLASELHQEQLKKRCFIADRAIELWDKYGYKKALAVACAEFKEEKQPEIQEVTPKKEENKEIDVPF